MYHERIECKDMNSIIIYGKNFMMVSDNIAADYHKHWLLQLFLTGQKDFNIDVNRQHIICSSILVNLDTPHTFNNAGDTCFTMLIDPTTELGRRMMGVLMNQPYYLFSPDETKAMQSHLQNILIHKSKDAYLTFVQSLLFQFSNCNIEKMDERVVKVLDLLDECVHEDENHQLKYFAEKLNLSESRLAHLFKEETGIPLKSYIVLHKLQKAYELIGNGESITTAALNAGFNSPSHLAYTNKMMTGMSATNILKDSEFLKAF